MAIVQDAFFIPEDIAIGLATGVYRRIGGVIRYAVGPNKGQIVKHLKPIDLNAAAKAQNIGMQALKVVKDNKKKSLGIAMGAVAVGAAAYGYFAIKNHEPKVVTEFRASLRVYIDAIREGNLNIDKINNLMAALEQLKKHKDYEKISIQLTTEELEVLVSRICEYTIKLAKDNDVELREEELNTAGTNSSGVIINLQNCLKAQKSIFERAV